MLSWMLVNPAPTMLSKSCPRLAASRMARLISRSSRFFYKLSSLPGS